jgi:deoxyribonuclease-4
VWIGAHVATGGRETLLGAISAAREVGADCAQIWGSNPRAWAPPTTAPDAARRFGEAWRSAGLGPLVLHSPYMVNVASTNAEFRRRSVELARTTVALCEQIGAAGVVVHSGAAGAATPRAEALRVAGDSFRRIADAAGASHVLVELMAGTAGAVASTFSEARELLDACEMHERLALAADTCHLFAAGYALDDANGVAACFAELRAAGLARRLRLVHANDSRHPSGLHRDSHEHIGRGHIGERGFAAILAQPAVRRCPVIVETAGEDADRAGDVAILRRLAPRARKLTSRKR